MRNRSTDMAGEIRKAFRLSGRSILSIAKETALPYAAVHGLLREGSHSDARLGTVSKVADVLGLELRPRRKATRKSGKVV